MLLQRWHLDSTGNSKLAPIRAAIIIITVTTAAPVPRWDPQPMDPVRNCVRSQAAPVAVLIRKSVASLPVLDLTVPKGLFGRGGCVPSSRQSL